MSASQIIKDVQDNIFICEPLFPYYFLLIAMMTKATFINSQQLLFIILFICEAITLHMISLFLFIYSLLFYSLRIIAR